MSSSQSSLMNRPIPVKTALSERIGLRYPLVSAPMFLISNPAMLISSAKSGILGAMPSLNARTNEDFQAMLREVKSATDLPFAINLTIGLTDPERRRADLYACIDQGVKVLITSYGDPTEIVQEAHRHGMIVLHDVISLKHALKAQTAGVDAVIGVSAGAGGHAGSISPFAFIPWLKNELSIPVVAAGAISNGSQVLSALSLGAELCYMGTRFIVSEECGASSEYKDLVVSASPEEIVYTDEVSGINANFLRSTLPKEGPRTRESPRKRWRDIWSAGHGVAQISDRTTISEIVHHIMEEYHLALGGVRRLSELSEEATDSEPRTDQPQSQVIPLSRRPREPSEYFNLTEILFDVHFKSETYRGNQIALVCPEGNWTYVSVFCHIQKYMSMLANAHVRVGDRVLIAVRDSADFVAALFASIRHGAVGVMINPDLESERISELIGYSRASFAFVEQGETAERFAEALNLLNGEAFVQLQIVEGSQRSERPEYPYSIGNEWSPAAKTHRDDPAIWLFSGGTTGRPKAIIQPHRSFLYTTEHYALGVMNYTESDRTLSVPKLYFGYATGANLIFPLAAGGSTILFADKPTPEKLFELIKAHDPTILINVPTLINRMVNHPKASEQDLRSLRVVTSAGEALPTALSEAWSALYNAPLCDGLGTAEMWHIFLTNHPSDSHLRREGTLGKVVEGFEISLRDPDDLSHEVKVNTPGVMWVRGGARALGYWQQVEASQKAFKGEWYASGDLMMRDEDGFYTFCGRSDDMIKVAGKFASPKEVEDELIKHELINECAVVGRPDASGLMKLFAFVTLLKSECVNVDEVSVEIATYLESKLDRYKLPKSIVVLDEFPKTHLGKISRGMLQVK